MKTLTIKALLTPVVALGAAVFLAGCADKGPAQKTGEKIDRGVDKVKDKLDPAGPAEKAGRKIDNATDGK